jgi:hypothetical protein
VVAVVVPEVLGIQAVILLEEQVVLDCLLTFLAKLCIMQPVAVVAIIMLIAQLEDLAD